MAFPTQDDFGFLWDDKLARFITYFVDHLVCAILQKPIIAGYTADELLADVLTLDCKGRQSVRDYIELQMKASRNNK